MSINHITRPVRALAVAILTLGVTLGVGSTGVQAAPASHPHKHPQTQTWTVQVGSQSPDMAIQGMRFLPGSITINAGDTVNWVARSAEIHTVTFFPGGGPQTKLPDFNPADPKQLTQQGGSVYDSTMGFNSGLITTVPTGGDIGPFPPVPHVQSYKLTFPKTGTFTYYCLVHGLMMVGTIHVNAPGTPYPYTQAQYDQMAQQQADAMRAMGVALAGRLAHHSSNHLVFAGGDNGVVALMRFIRPTVFIRAGESVTWKNPGMGAPHTVTFGNEPPPPGLFNPSGDPRHYAGGDLNSGIIPPQGTFSVRFLKPGVYPYVCALHDSMGMRGKVVVLRHHHHHHHHHHR
ncbi:MAG: cupredoxin domain-containing protein [Nocardioidaceae bacterium]